MRKPGGEHHVFAFGEFRLDTDRGALLKGDTEVRLRAKSFEVLRYLVERHGELVSKDDLFAAIWGRTVVSDDTLTQCLIDARRAIDDQSRQAIRTVPRRGYIFTPAVCELLVPELTAAPVDGHDAGIRRPVRLAGAAAALAITLVVWGVSAYVTRDGFEAGAGARPAADRPAIAVLPFVDMSLEGGNQYFAEGIAEEILNVLAQLPELRVIARTSSFSFKPQNPDIATIAAKLGVAYVLEGSVRRAGDRIKVTAQLVDASNSMHLWSQTYDRELGDVLDVQTGIAGAVADSLQLTLTGGATHSHDAPRDVAAYEHFLQAQFFYSRRSPGDLELARFHYQQALDSDPHYAAAWAGIAGTYFIQTVAGEIAPEIGWPGMREAVAEALEHNPRLAEAHARADQYHSYTGDRESALEHRLKALQYGPNSPLVLSRMAGTNAFRGRFHEAIEFQRRAVALDPLAVIGRTNLAFFLRAAGRFDEAQEQFLSALTLNPHMRPELEIELGFLSILQGRFDEALPKVREWREGPDKYQAMAFINHATGEKPAGDAALENLLRLPGSDVARRIAEVYAYRGQIDEAFNWLNGSHEHFLPSEYSSYNKWIDDICLSPFLRPLHDDPRWGALMRQAGGPTISTEIFMR